MVCAHRGIRVVPVEVDVQTGVTRDLLAGDINCCWVTHGPDGQTLALVASYPDRLPELLIRAPDGELAIVTSANDALRDLPLYATRLVRWRAADGPDKS